MAKRTQKSAGGGDFRMTIDTHDLTDEVTQALRLALHRALTKIGLVAVGYAKRLCPVDTGRLRNSITFYTEDNAVHIGTNVEYAQFVEEGTSKQKPKPYLKPAVENHLDQYRQILEDELRGN